MIYYYKRVPSAAVRREFDGNTYAYSNCRLQQTDSGRIIVVEASVNRARLLRVELIKNGEGYVYLGCAGEAIAGRANLPFGVDAIPTRLMA
jgi:hypothetical protein